MVFPTWAERTGSTWWICLRSSWVASMGFYGWFWVKKNRMMDDYSFFWLKNFGGLLNLGWLLIWFYSIFGWFLSFLGQWQFSEFPHQIFSFFVTWGRLRIGWKKTVISHGPFGILFWAHRWLYLIFWDLKPPIVAQFGSLSLFFVWNRSLCSFLVL